MANARRVQPLSSNMRITKSVNVSSNDGKLDASSFWRSMKSKRGGIVEKYPVCELETRLGAVLLVDRALEIRVPKDAVWKIDKETFRKPLTNLSELASKTMHPLHEEDSRC